ncbi:P-loop containing nucleoside triphosphate hydrolase protein, partial [Dichotomocladium elegans]
MDCIDGEADDTDNDDDSGDEYVPGAKKATKKPRERKRMTNVILLYGPHGVGKTASVYTAAQELGYEVFEINPSSRRSGKDLMAAVGEMIESHQVNFQEDTDDVDIMDITQEDGENSDSVVQPLTVAAAAAAATAPNSHIPRQSLVLIEEVDILFEEDKGFWSAIVELSEKSKRPIILTCNDIDVLPIESLAFDKMLEFVPQSTKTLIPYLQ